MGAFFHASDEENAKRIGYTLAAMNGVTLDSDDKPECKIRALGYDTSITCSGLCHLIWSEREPGYCDRVARHQKSRRDDPPPQATPPMILTEAEPTPPINLTEAEPDDEPTCYPALPVDLTEAGPEDEPNLALGCHPIPTQAEPDREPSQSATECDPPSPELSVAEATERRNQVFEEHFDSRSSSSRPNSERRDHHWLSWSRPY